MGRPREISAQEREELIRQGYRPIEIWVPDVSSEAFRLQIDQEMQRIVEANEKDDVESWIEAVGPTDWDRP